MSEDLADEPFRAAAKKVEEAHDLAAEELKAKVAEAKASALTKLEK